MGSFWKLANELTVADFAKAIGLVLLAIAPIDSHALSDKEILNELASNVPSVRQAGLRHLKEKFPVLNEFPTVVRLFDLNEDVETRSKLKFWIPDRFYTPEVYWQLKSLIEGEGGGAFSVYTRTLWTDYDLAQQGKLPVRARILRNLGTPSDGFTRSEEIKRLQEFSGVVDVIPDVLTGLMSDNSQQAIGTALAFSDIAGWPSRVQRDAVPVLTRVLKTPDGKLRIGVSLALSFLGHPPRDQREVLRPMLDSTDPLMRLAAAGILARAHPDDSSVEKTLRQGLSSAQPDVRQLAIAGLDAPEFKSRISVDELIERYRQERHHDVSQEASHRLNARGVLFPREGHAATPYKIFQMSDGDIFLYGASCDALRAQVESIYRWAQRLGDTTAQLPLQTAYQPSAFGVECRVSIFSALPLEFRELHGTCAAKDGPNCWNAAMVMAGILPVFQAASYKQMTAFMNSPLCRMLDLNEAAAPGDLIAIRQKYEDNDPWETHGMIYLSDGLVFSKNGETADTPYAIQNLDVVMNGYGVTNPLCRKVGEARPKECEFYAQYYRCQTMQEFMAKMPAASRARYAIWNGPLSGVECGADALNGLDVTLPGGKAIVDFNLGVLGVLESHLSDEIEKLSSSAGRDERFWRQSLLSRVRATRRTFEQSD